MSGQLPIPMDKSRVLIVEGPGDEHVLSKYLEYLGWQDLFHLTNCGGKNKLAIQLSNILRDDNFPNLRQIGIVCDNDYPDQRKGKSGIDIVADHINTANSEAEGSFAESRQLPIPLQPRQPVGTVPIVSVLLLPADVEDGTVENLIFEALGHDSIMDCVDAYFGCLAGGGLNANKARTPKANSVSIFPEK